MTSKTKRKTWLLLDCNYLCHRAKHSMGGLTHKGDATGVIYGFLKSLSGYLDLFGKQSRLVFCWDSKTSIRQAIFPGYKSNRVVRQSERTEEEIVLENEFREQMRQLRKSHLRTIGFRNIFCQKGCEADDVIASICKELSFAALFPKHNDRAIIISSDKDMYQCITKYISLYDPQKNQRVKLQDFINRFGIKPYEWAMMKALAGCTTDAIPGIERVGEKTARKYLQGELKETTKAYQAITSKEGLEIYQRNWGLVHLPFKGTKKFKLKDGKLSKAGWKKVTKKLGMKSLKDKMPF